LSAQYPPCFSLLHDGGNPQDVRFGFAATQEMIGSKLAELA